MKKSISALLIVVSMLLAACLSDNSGGKTKETTVEYTFPGEWEKHEGTWLIWPHNYGVITAEYVDAIDDIWVTMTKSLHTGERVHIVVYNDNERSRISTLLEGEGCKV